MALPILFNKKSGRTMNEIGISLINAKDNINAINFAAFLKEKRKKIIVLIDKDSSDNKVLKPDKLRKKLGFIQDKDYFLNGKYKEFEDEFPIEIWIKMLNIYFKKTDETEWTAVDINYNHNKDKLSDLLLERVRNLSNSEIKVTKPNLNYYLAKIINKDEIPLNITNFINELILRLEKI